MSAPDWNRVEELFHRARELPNQARRAALEDWCGDDPMLLAEVRSLLAADSEVELLLTEARSTQSAGDFLTRELQIDPWIGARLGRFRLEQLLGRGGMGSVYLGRRDPGPMAHPVAIKVIAQTLRSSPVLQQFLAERDALARMEHRHIARLIDAGVDGDTPYVVMEYVAGRRLDEHCDQPGVALRDTLHLFLQVCDAVAYVHGHLILHRDLKPGNVMVTPDGVVKLLDFGALKRLDLERADSQMTRAGLRPMTLNYSSPEHIGGEQVSTATDVYSLGVMLYRLLAGRVPHDSAGKSLSRFLAELRSEKLSSPTLALEAPRHLRADLDAIVEKALRADPAQRYSSVDAMAADVRNALHSRPVVAHVGRLAHRASKFVARHRRGLMAASAVLLTLAAGLLAIGREGEIARGEAVRAQTGVETERSLTHLLLFDYFDNLKQIPGSTDAQQRALLQAVRYLDSMSGVLPASQWLADRATGYTRLGNLLGNPYEENVGDTAHAITTLEKAVALSGQLVAAGSADPAALSLAANAQQALGRVYFGSGDPQRAAKYLTEAAATSERLAASPGVDAATLAQAASTVDTLGDLYGQDGAVTLDDPAAALDAYLRAQGLDARGLQIDAACTRCRRGIALEDWKMGTLTESVDLPHALDLYRHGLDTLAQAGAQERTSARVLRIDTVIRQRLGSGLVASGATGQGITLLGQVHDRFAAAIRNDPLDERARFDLAALDNSLVDDYVQARDSVAARQTVEEFLELMNHLVEKDGANETWQYLRAQAMIRYARIAAPGGSQTQREKIRDQGIANLVRLAGSAQAGADVLIAASDALLDAGRDPMRALDFATRATKSLKRPSTKVLLSLARAQQAAGLSQQSRLTATQVLALLSQHPRGLNYRDDRAQAQAFLSARLH